MKVSTSFGGLGPNRRDAIAKVYEQEWLVLDNECVRVYGQVMVVVSIVALVESTVCCGVIVERLELESNKKLKRVQAGGKQPGTQSLLSLQVLIPKVSTLGIALSITYQSR